jgi:hypothetical protein
MALALYAFGVHHAFMVDQAAQTTVDNVHDRVRSWLDNFGLTVQNGPADDRLFRYVVTMKNGDQIDISRPKERDRYLVIATSLRASEEEKQLLSKLSEDQSARLQADMTTKAAEAHLAFTNMTVPFDNVYLEKRVPITSSLTEAVFIGSVDEMDAGLVILRTTSMMALRKEVRLKQR